MAKETDIDIYEEAAELGAVVERFADGGIVIYTYARLDMETQAKIWYQLQDLRALQATSDPLLIMTHVKLNALDQALESESAAGQIRDRRMPLATE